MRSIIFSRDRYLESKRNYLLRTIRYLSFFVILPPAVMSFAYLVANGLVKPDNSDHSKTYWKEKLFFLIIGLVPVVAMCPKRHRNTSSSSFENLVLKRRPLKKL